MGGKNNPETCATYYEKNKADIRNKQAAKYILDEEHREAAKARTKAWRKNNLDTSLEYGRDWRNACKEEVNTKGKARHQEILEEMSGRPKPTACEICGNTKEKIVLDHAHYTQEFRGWICDGCNKALGSVLDSPERLEKLAAYVREYDEKNNSAGLRDDYYKAERKVQRLQSLPSYKSACKRRMVRIREQRCEERKLPVLASQGYIGSECGTSGTT
jgi:hypothetical protein